MKNSCSSFFFLCFGLAIFPFASRSQNDSLLAEKFTRLSLAASNPDSMVFYREQALAAWQKFYPESHPKVVDAMNLLGGTYAGSRGDTDASIVIRTEALALAERLGDSLRMARLFNNLGKLYEVKKAYAKAITFCRQGLAILPKGGTREELLLWENLVLLYGHVGELEEALVCSHHADSLLDAQPDMMGRNFHWKSLGLAYLQNQRFEEALDCFQRNWQCLIPHRKERSFPSLARDCQVALATCYLQTGKPDSSLICVDSAIFFVKQTISPSISTRLLDYHRLKASALGEKGNFEQAHRLLKSVLDSVRFHGDFSTISDHEAAFHAFAGQGKLFFKEYQINGDNRLLHLCLEAFRRADSAARIARRRLPDLAARRRLSEVYAGHFETAIAACLALQRQTGEEKFAVEAFHFSENCKNLQLSEAFREMDARQLPGAPAADLLGHEDRLRKEIDSLRWRRENVPLPPEEIAACDRQTFELVGELENLLDHFRLENREFYELRFGGEQVDIANLQACCQRDSTAIVEYFWGKERLFAFVVNDSATWLTELTQPGNWQDTIAVLRERLTTYDTSENNALTIPKIMDYQRTAVALYQLLIAPLKPAFRPRLVLVPDGALYLLPFAALLEDVPRRLDQFHNYPYLCVYYAISHAFSANLLQQMENRRHSGSKDLGNFLGVAPDFNFEGQRLRWVRKTEDGELSRIKHNIPEVQEIFATLGTGAVLVGLQSNLDSLLAWIENFRIVHFATHALLDDRRGENSCLVLQSAERLEDLQRFYLWEILHLRLRADLVMLAACHTAEGDPLRTEGLRSLGRAFAHAGAKSVFANLWEAHDETSLQVNVEFYRRLKAGQSKDRALQGAMNDHLRRTKWRKSHPFFWAGWVGYGDRSELKFLSD